MTQGFYGVKGLHPNPLKDREIVIVKFKKKKNETKQVRRRELVQVGLAGSFHKDL